METFTLEQLKDEFIGEKDTPERIKYEQELVNEKFKLNNIDKSLGRLLKQCRKERKLKLKDVANLSGMKVPQVSKIENGYNSVSIVTLNKILEALNLEIVFKNKK